MGVPSVGIDGDFFQFFQIAGILEFCYFPVFEVRSTYFLLFTVFRVKVCRNTRCAFFFFIDYKNRFIFFKLRYFEDFFGLCVRNI